MCGIYITANFLTEDILTVISEKRRTYQGTLKLRILHTKISKTSQKNERTRNAL